MSTSTIAGEFSVGLRQRRNLLAHRVEIAADFIEGGVEVVKLPAVAVELGQVGSLSLRRCTGVLPRALELHTWLSLSPKRTLHPGFTTPESVVWKVSNVRSAPAPDLRLLRTSWVGDDR
jgi:hypothetical protein